jgi:membrane-bound lytic murein transglycosylase MltF
MDRDTNARVDGRGAFEVGERKSLSVLAAYNAGPARIRALRTEAAEEGLDPNVWFGNVEVVAARRVGRETVRYVSNITKYWIACRMSVALGDARKSE